MTRDSSTNFLPIQSKNNSGNTALRAFIMLVFMVMCTGGVFGQNKVQDIKDADNNGSPSSEVSSGTGSSSKMELLLWFMGSKQIWPNQDEMKSDESGKKVFINLGMTPNRILSKSLMKKALNFEQTTV